MTIIGTFPATIANGQVEDATVVMSLFSWIQAQTNGNACPATVGTLMLKGDGFGGTTGAAAGTDYVSPTTLVGATGSSLVGFQLSATGAAAQTLFTKASQTVSVTDFYANGVSGALVDPTGVIDSTLGIQAACNSFGASGGVVRGNGLFKTSATITVPRGVSIIGDIQGSWSGATFPANYDMGFAIMPLFSGNVISHTGTVGHDSLCVFENVTILGQKNLYPTGNGFNLSNANNTITRRCRVINIGGHGFVSGDTSGNSYHNYYYNCYSLGCGGNGYQIQSTWVRLIDCWADTNQVGINVAGTPNNDYQPKIIRCHAEENNIAAIQINGAAGNSGGGSIEDCVIYSRLYPSTTGPGHGIWFNTTSSAAGCTGYTVRGNTLTYQNSYGAANTGTIGIVLGNGASGNTVSENNVTGFGQNLSIGNSISGCVVKINTFNGVNCLANFHISSASAVTFEGNTIYGSVGGVYSLQASGQVLTLIGNNFDLPVNCHSASKLSCNTGFGTGTFTPVFTGLTVVNGTGGVAYAGSYHIEGNTCFWSVTITITGTATTASSGSGVYFSGNPFGPVTMVALNVMFNNSASGTTLMGQYSGPNGYLPAWSAINQNIAITGNFMIS